MAEPTRIEEVAERARDFSRALREAGAEDVAQRIERQVGGFVDTSTVRRSVEAIRQQLRHFRAYPEELPEQPVVHIAANRLEDACKDALRADLIAPARLSLRAQGKRKLRIVFATVTACLLMFAVPLALAMTGVDFSDLRRERALPTLVLPQGSVQQVAVNVLDESVDPEHTTSVELYVQGRCPPQLGSGMGCRTSGERAFGELTLPAYEVMLPDEVYGVHVAFTDTRLQGAVGTGTVVLMATPETPEGQYSVPLAGAFWGYQPAQCSLLLRVLAQCTEHQLGPAAQDADRLVPTLSIQVVAPLPIDQTRDLAAERRQRQQRELAERVEKISAMTDAVRTAIADVEKLVRRKRFEPARERLDELAGLFEPLDALVVSTVDDESLPNELLGLRARLNKSLQKQRRFEDKAFDVVYAALDKRGGSSADDEQVLVQVAKRLAVSVAFLERIYAEHAEQLELRMQREQQLQREAEQREQEALLARCGPLPTSSFREVQAYLSARASHLGSRMRMQECMTPRLSAQTCWSVVCEFQDIVSRQGALQDEVYQRTWTFELRKGRVVRHREGRVQD